MRISALPARKFFPVLPALAVLALGFALAAGRADDGVQTNAAAAAPPEVTNYTYDVVNTFPHDRQAFTEGLVFNEGRLLESTGLYGESKLREVELATGKTLREVKVPDRLFGEGLALLNGKLYQLTWKNQTALVYDLKTWQKEKELKYTGEGWGLTTDGQSLIMSDGSSTLRFLDPATFDVKRTVQVLFKGRAMTNLNELEWVKGEVFANVWRTPYIARIDPASGRVTGLIDLSHLLAPQDTNETTDVLNGIAYDAATDRLFVTGKRWPKLFEIRLKKR